MISLNSLIPINLKKVNLFRYIFLTTLFNCDILLIICFELSKQITIYRCKSNAQKSNGYNSVHFSELLLLLYLLFVINVPSRL